MKINDMTNLFVAYNAKEDFRVVILALDFEEANEIARNYFLESHMDTSMIDIAKFDYIDTKIDCDYVLS